MNRYFYYSIIMCMLINVILYVPYILISHRNDGAILGLLFSTVIGTVLTVIFTSSIKKFKNQGIPEIFSSYLPSYIRGGILLYLGFMWFIAGSIVLVAYTIILKRFIIPDIDLEITLTFFLIAISWCASKTTKTILYLLEIILLFTLPLIAIILFKALTNEYMNWNAIWDIASDHFMSMPNLDVIAAATYLYTGYINMAIFNKEFGGNFQPHYIWAIPLLGISVLAVTLFIPIGFFGTIGVGNLIYPWVSTADAMRMEFGFVERVVYIFLLLYLSLTLIFVTVSWHVGYQLISSITPKNPVIRSIQLKPIIIFVVFMIITLFLIIFYNERQNIQLALLWLKIRFFSEVGLVFFVYYLYKRAKEV